MKFKHKILVFLSVVLLSSLLLLAGCQPTPDNNTVQPPEETYKVHSVSIKMNDENVNGTITTDISIGELQLTATVKKDAKADGSVTFSSNNPSVATVDNSGKVTLVGKGEAVIQAKAGSKTHSIVVIVKDDYSEVKTYTITVNGGVSSVTAAAAGEYVTLEAAIPDHMDFERWNYSVKGVLTNGNVFRMPAEDIVITAKYSEKLYTLNVVGAKAVYGDGELLDGTYVGNSEYGTLPEYDIYSYGVTYDTEVKVIALDGVDEKIFVGWDGGAANNRVGQMGISEHEFDMPGQNYTIWAKYSKLQTTVFSASNPRSYWDTTKGSKVISNGVPSGESADPDLEGLSGYRLTFSGSDSPLTGYTTENIPGSVLDTIVEGTNTMKVIFKNHGDYDVTLEVYASYYGNIATSGYVTIPAHSVVTKYFTGGLGIYKPYFGVALRENIQGVKGTFNVDMVLGSAPMYPDGDPLLETTGKAQLLEFDASTDKKYNWAREFNYNSQNGVLTYAIYGAQFASNTPASRSVQITNMPEYDPENPYTTIYARVINNATSGDYLSVFDVCVSQERDVRNVEVPCETVVHEQIGDVVVIKITVPRTENDGPFYLSVRKTTVEGTGTYYPHNFSMVLAYNNVFGYEEEDD